MEFVHGLETLIADIEKVTRSEHHVRHIASLIEEEIHEKCPSDSQHMEENKRKRSYKKKKIIFSLCCSSIKWIFGILFLMIFSFAISPEKTVDTIDQYTKAFAYYTKIDRYFIKPTEYDPSQPDFVFYILQLLRSGTTKFKLEEKFPISDQDLEACIVPNPLYRENKVECSVCQKTLGFGRDTTLKTIESFDTPVLVKNQEIDFNLARLQQLLSKNPVMLNEHTVLLSSNTDYLKTVEDLKDNAILEQLENDPKHHIAGIFVSYMSSHVIRKEFPRPQKLITEVAQTSKSYLYIDGKDSPSYILHKALSNFMYIQAVGSRRLTFLPPDHCSTKCKSFSRLMIPGDVVIYSNLWRIQSEASNEKSLSFVDNFDWVTKKDDPEN